jgi:hypothetical protein
MQHPRGIEKDVALAQLRDRWTSIFLESKKCFTSTVPSLKPMIYFRDPAVLPPIDGQIYIQELTRKNSLICCISKERLEENERKGEKRPFFSPPPGPVRAEHWVDLPGTTGAQS